MADVFPEDHCDSDSEPSGDEGQDHTKVNCQGQLEGESQCSDQHPVTADDTPEVESESESEDECEGQTRSLASGSVRDMIGTMQRWRGEILADVPKTPPLGRPGNVLVFGDNAVPLLSIQDQVRLKNC